MRGAWGVGQELNAHVFQAAEDERGMWWSCWMSGVLRRSNGSACRRNDRRLARAWSRMNMSLSSTPPCDQHLSYTSSTTTFTAPIRSDLYATALQQLVQPESRGYQSCDLQIHPRIGPETAVATRPRVPSHKTQTRLCRRRIQQKPRLIDKNRPPVLSPFFSPQSALPPHL